VDGEQHLGDCQSWRPLIHEHVQTERASAVDVGVVDLGDEFALRWPKGVVCGEEDVEDEDAAGVGAVLRADDGCCPVEFVVFILASKAIGRRVFLEVEEFFKDSLLGHLYIIRQHSYPIK
jgi:hypothetical protein